MKWLIALLLCLSAPALAQAEVTILRGTPAPPPPPEPQVIVVEQPAPDYLPAYYYGYPYYVVPRRHVRPVQQHQHNSNGWPLFRR